MATCGDMLDDLNDRIQDPGNSQLSEATKIRFLNHGVRATWPKLYKTARDTTLVFATDTYEYNVPSAVGSNTKIVRVEMEVGVASGRYVDLYDFDIIPGLTDPILSLRMTSVPTAGARIRITAAKRLTDFVNTASTYDGPIGTEELPVLYALGLVAGRQLDDRLDHKRYSTVAAINGVGPEDLMGASQFWFGQYEMLLDRFAMPLPAPAQ
jgi:hypothetical protein